MFISEQNNNKEIENLLLPAEQLDCAVAFVGHGAEQYFKNKKSARLICNLTTGSTNPDTIQELQKMGVALKNCSNLHAKVYLTPNTMIVSSSNLSANGLGLEEKEIKGWRECGVRIEDSNEIRKAQEWFNGLWNESEDITEEMIEAAKIEWKKRRIARPRTDLNHNFVDLVLDKSIELKNREIYFAVTFEYYSDEVDKKVNELKHESDLIAVYEDWDDLPENAYLIDIFVGPRGGIQFHGIYKTPQNKKLLPITLESGEKENLFVCYEVDGIDDYIVSLYDIRSRLKEYLRVAIAEYCPNREAAFFSVDDFMRFID
ncbi:phospholipase D-like domain-containing protein [Agitococcus lubricus]|uniref:Phospholipase D-like protein n=1 Tax=Agitococcus lubricus TaxID=1077255 RepID=A0A2T5ISC6_9GAMM|nr:phospholipase D-like domain-containing protein [Agitococcus lubricus]PTQ86725.1 phospholipase D-like protein [Agitococcus lubricus]